MPRTITARPGSAIWRCTNLDQVERLHIEEFNPYGFAADGGLDDMTGGDPEAAAAAGITISDGITTLEVEDVLSHRPLVVLSPTLPPFFQWEQLDSWEAPTEEESMQAFLDVGEG